MDGVAPSTTCAPSCPVARNIAATTLATWALNPRLAALRGADQVLACVEFRDRFGRGVQAFFDDLARDSNVGGDAPAAPLDGVDGGGLCRNRGCPRGRRARRPSRLRRRRRRPRWRWWPCSSPSRPWCRSGIAGTPSCRRRTASRRGVRRGSSSSAASFSAAKLSRVHETSAPRPRQRRRRGTPARGSSRT